MAAAKRKRDGRVAKAQRERAQRLLKLESVDGGTADAEGGEHKKGHTRIVTGNGSADAPRRGSGRVVRAGSKYVLAQLNDQAQDSQIVERRPWYALSLSLSLSLCVSVCLSVSVSVPVLTLTLFVAPLCVCEQLVDPSDHVAAHR